MFLISQGSKSILSKIISHHLVMLDQTKDNLIICVFKSLDLINLIQNIYKKQYQPK